MSDLEEYLLVVDEPKYIKEFYDMRSAEVRSIDYVLIIEQFQKLLGVYTTTEALAKVAILMREETLSESLLSKALGHLHSCSCQGSSVLYQEIASAFGKGGLTPRAADGEAVCVCNVDPAVNRIDGVCLLCGLPRR